MQLVIRPDTTELRLSAPADIAEFCVKMEEVIVMDAQVMHSKAPAWALDTLEDDDDEPLEEEEEEEAAPAAFLSNRVRVITKVR